MQMEISYFSFEKLSGRDRVPWRPMVASSIEPMHNPLFFVEEWDELLVLIGWDAV